MCFHSFTCIHWYSSWILIRSYICTCIVNALPLDYNICGLIFRMILFVNLFINAYSSCLAFILDRLPFQLWTAQNVSEYLHLVPPLATPLTSRLIPQDKITHNVAWSIFSTALATDEFLPISLRSIIHYIEWRVYELQSPLLLRVCFGCLLSSYRRTSTYYLCVNLKGAFAQRFVHKIN
jgi:hypothetical protein